ncbi:MAG: TraR/DksA C4-type zinc finger protein [Desulfuromonadaceae bacterium]|nr:TraR/DksA C4-type zinc finger protein [Desulfuromonadaceae bacterium]
MPDEIDQVQQHVNDLQAEQLLRHQLRREPDDNSGIECEDCGDEIPLRRRRVKPGCRRCISCQEKFERGGII